MAPVLRVGKKITAKQRVMAFTVQSAPAPFHRTLIIEFSYPILLVNEGIYPLLIRTNDPRRGRGTFADHALKPGEMGVCESQAPTLLRNTSGLGHDGVTQLLEKTFRYSLSLDGGVTFSPDLMAHSERDIQFLYFFRSREGWNENDYRDVLSPSAREKMQLYYAGGGAKTKNLRVNYVSTNDVDHQLQYNYSGGDGEWEKDSDKLLRTYISGILIRRRGPCLRIRFTHPVLPEFRILNRTPHDLGILPTLSNSSTSVRGQASKCRAHLYWAGHVDVPRQICEKMDMIKFAWPFPWLGNPNGEARKRFLAIDVLRVSRKNGDVLDLCCDVSKDEEKGHADNDNNVVWCPTALGTKHSALRVFGNAWKTTKQDGNLHFWRHDWDSWQTGAATLQTLETVCTTNTGGSMIIIPRAQTCVLKDGSVVKRMGDHTHGRLLRRMEEKTKKTHGDGGAPSTEEDRGPPVSSTIIVHNFLKTETFHLRTLVQHSARELTVYPWFLVRNFSHRNIFISPNPLAVSSEDAEKLEGAGGGDVAVLAADLVPKRGGASSLNRRSVLKGEEEGEGGVRCSSVSLSLVPDLYRADAGLWSERTALNHEMLPSKCCHDYD